MMKLEDYKKSWGFSLDTLYGTGGFFNGNFLDKYPRESEDKFKNRQEIAYYTNLFAPRLNRYVGYIFKQKPLRQTSNNLLKIVLEDIDNKGSNANTFFSKFAKNLKARGSNLVLIDMQKELSSNLQEQIESRNLPYTVEILPERVIKYRLDRYGRFDFIMFSDTIDNSTLNEDDIKEVKRYYDKSVWRVYSEEDEIIEEGEHNLGLCPVVSFNEDGLFPSLSEFSQVPNLLKRHYNLQSEMDEILRGQTFSILTIQADVPSDVAIKIDTDNAIGYSKEAQRPDFISPPSAPADIYQNKIKDIESQIATVMYDINTNQTQESGISLDIKFQGLNSSLSNFAFILESGEMRVFEVICRYLGINSDIEISYPKTFSIIDTEKEIGVLDGMKNLVNSPTYVKLKAMQIVSNDLSSINQEELDVIAGEIEDDGKEV